MRGRTIINVVAIAVWVLVQTAMAYAGHDVSHGAAKPAHAAMTVADTVQSTDHHPADNATGGHHDAQSRIAPAEHQHEDADADSCAVACFAVVMFDLTGESSRLRVREQFFADDRLVMGLHPELPTPPPNVSL